MAVLRDSVILAVWSLCHNVSVSVLCSRGNGCVRVLVSQWLCQSVSVTMVVSEC